MTVLAIDPGPQVSTWVRYGGGVVLGIGRNVPNATILENIPKADVPIIVEDIESYGLAVGESIFATCRWSGRFQERAYRAGVEIHFLKRKAIKLHLCGNSNANERKVRAALLDRFGASALQGIADHAWSALAVAVTWEDQHALGFTEPPRSTGHHARNLSPSHRKKTRLG